MNEVRPDSNEKHLISVNLCSTGVAFHGNGAILLHMICINLEQIEYTGIMFKIRSMAPPTPLFICSTGHNMWGRLAFLAFDDKTTKCTLASRSYFAGGWRQ